MKYHTLFLLKIRETVAKFVVCCSRDWRFRNCQLHLQIHSGEKKYVCDICDKAFATANYLHKHKKMHKEEKPYNAITVEKRLKTVIL